MDWITLNYSYFSFLLIDLVAILLLVAAMRWLSRLMVRPVKEHEEASNIDSGAAILAIMIALTGVASGSFSLSLLNEWGVVTAYGLLAIVLLRAGAWLQDKLVLPSVSLSSETEQGNDAAAFIAGSHMIGTAIVIQSSMKWVSQDGNLGLIALLFGFVISQLLLALETRLRMLWTSNGITAAAKAHKNLVAMKYSLQHVGAALAISASSHFASAMQYELHLAVIAWLLSSIVFLTVFLILSELSLRIVLPRAGEREEGRPLLEGAIYLGWGFILPALAS